MRRFTIFAAIAALATAAQAEPPPAEGWSQIDDDTETTIYIRDKDWTAGRPDSESVMVWTWIHQKRKRGVSHTIMLVQINCPSESYRTVKVTDYSTTGKATDLGTADWDFATPNTVIGEIVRLTCLPPQQEGVFS